MLDVLVKENLVLKTKIYTRQARKETMRAEIINLTDEEADAIRSCEYCNF